jgi:hypothetical protein
MRLAKRSRLLGKLKESIQTFWPDATRQCFSE